MKSKIIKRIFYEKYYIKSTVFICSKTREYVSPRKYIVDKDYFGDHGLPDCPHCGATHTDGTTDHYDIIHGNILRPNFLGRLFLMDPILTSGVIYR